MIKHRLERNIFDRTPCKTVFSGVSSSLLGVMA
jgi:hypothetical protein